MLARKLADEHARSTRKMKHLYQIYGKKVESDVSSGVLHFENGKSNAIIVSCYRVFDRIAGVFLGDLRAKFTMHV